VCHKDSQVVVRLTSGLGNQLFQLAQGMSVAAENRASLSFDTTWFQLISGLHPVRRQLRLSKFRVSLPEAFDGPRRLAVGLFAAFFDKTGKGKSLLAGLGGMQVIQENPHSPESTAPPKSTASNTGRIYLNGYWQTSESFIKIRESLLPKLEPVDAISSNTKSLLASIRSGETGFIHVRRGDYIHFLGEKGTLPASYYSRAISALRASGKRISRWLIYAEDQQWAHENLGFISDATVIDYESANRDVEDLMVMKECSAGIIANSSYSWWGAALGEHINRPIIAPDRYWRDSSQSLERWILPHWTQVKAWN
jgi:hypothetical protein